MSESVVTDWLNENSLRAYPLKMNIDRISGAYTLTNGVILDASLPYISLPNTVNVESIVVTTNSAVFTLTGTGSTFVCDKTAEFPQYIRNSNGQLLVIGEDVLEIPNGTYNFTNLTFEPSVCFEIGGIWSGVTQITANSTNLTGDVTVKSGYNCSVTASSNNITIAADKIYGIPVICGAISTLPNDCGTTVSMINGVTPILQKITFVGSSSISILNDPDNNRIFIAPIFGPNDICDLTRQHPSVI